MRQVSIIVAKDHLSNLLAFAGRKKLFHLTEVDEDKLPLGAQRYDAGRLLAVSSTVKNRIGAITSSLSLAASPMEKLNAPLGNLNQLADFADDETSKLEKTVRELQDEEGRLQTNREQNLELSRFLSGLENVGVSLDAITGSGFLSSIAGEAIVESIPSLRNELDDVTYGNMIFVITNTAEKAQTFLAIFPSVFLNDARQAVTALGARLGPPWIDLPTDPRKAKEAVDSRLVEIEEGSRRLRQRRETIVKEYGPRIRALQSLSEILESRARAVSNSSTTDSTCLLRAWIPGEQLQTLAEGASDACNGFVSFQAEKENSREGGHSPGSDHVETGVGNKDDDPPTLLKVPNWSRPLQSVIDNFGVPSYKETNPLPFMILTFPLIYGLMFGDFGEGPLFLLLGAFLLYLKRKKVKVFDIGQIFVNGAELVIMLGIGTTIFGFVFGDFFGFDSFALFGFHPLFSPTEGAFNPVRPDISHLLLYMEFILFFGVAHILSGLGVSAYNRLRNGEYRHAFLGPISWAWFYVVFVYAATLVVSSGFKFSVLLSNPLIPVLIFVPMGLMAYGEGGLHLMEVFIGAGSNTLSYLRIWALNLADFAIKFAFFTSFGIAGAIIGNVLVMILEGLIVFVQTLRLHWVEWFGKFYEGNGSPFAPYLEPTGWIVSP